MTVETLTVWDQEALHYLAEEILTRLRYCLYWYDDEGEDVLCDLAGPAREAALTGAVERQMALGDRDYLDFHGNNELRKLSFSEALEMPLKTIKGKYLKDVLGKARNMMRKGALGCGRVVVSGEVPDSYLDDLLALRWREDLKLWAIQWDREKERSEECEQPESPDDGGSGNHMPDCGGST